MNIGFSAARRVVAAIIAIPLGCIVVLNADGGGYLAIVGPAPLRFETVVAHTQGLTLPALAMDNSRPELRDVETSLSLTNSTPAVEAASIPAATNDVASMVLSAQSLEPHEGPQPNFDTTFRVSSSISSPVVTPQMLVEYFKPVPGATNGAGVSVFVPSDLGFTPPSTRSTSQATYKTE